MPNSVPPAPARARIYLAGPEVFRPDAAEEGRRLKALCEAAGVEGLYPLDAEEADIRAGCLSLLRRADAVVANISPFRGAHMDPGTAYEIGYAEALGLPVELWSADPRPLAARIPADPAHGAGRDAHGHLIEDFGKPENLMIVRDGQVVHASPAAAIAAVAARFGAQAQAAGDDTSFTARNAALKRETRMRVIWAFLAALIIAWGAGAIANRLVGW